jgi:hypothetical protein
MVQAMRFPVLIQKVFFAYCTQARNACRERVWTLAQVGPAVDAAWLWIFDSYFSRERGAVSETQKSAMRAAFWNTVADDQRWKQHLTELAALADRAVLASSLARGAGSENPNATNIEIEEKTENQPPMEDRERSAISLALIGANSRWASEAVKRADPDCPAALVVDESKDLLPRSQAGESIPTTSPIVSGAESRRTLLDEYKSAKGVGNPSNKRIYEARNSGIHKPQFYEWLNGQLSPDSTTTLNFERFLRDKKPPIPKKPAN